MAKETVSFAAPRAHGTGHGSLTQVEIDPMIAANERVIDLKLSTGHRFRLSAKAAHLLSVALYGASENHAEELPAINQDLEPGDLVQVFYRSPDGALRPYQGAYNDGCWKVSGSKKPIREGYIYLYRRPRDMVMIERELVTFHSRPDKR